MSAPLLYDRGVPNSVAFVLAWLLPISGVTLPIVFPFTFDPATATLGAKRWTAEMPLPYRMVRFIPSGEDLAGGTGRIKISTFHQTYTLCSREADRTHRRMNILFDDPLTDVTMLDGSTANCQSLTPCGEPHEESYGAQSVVIRFLSEYDLAMRAVPVAVT